jgi:O-antigen/teichoic acid export membrane protein
LLGSPGVGIAMVLNIYLIGRLNKPGLVSLFAWINTLINIVLCLLLIPRYGIMGAALSSTGMCVIGTVLMLLVFKKFSGYGIKDTILLRVEDLLSYYDIVKKVKGRLGGLKKQRIIT